MFQFLNNIHTEFLSQIYPKLFQIKNRSLFGAPCRTNIYPKDISCKMRPGANIVHFDYQPEVQFFRENMQHIHISSFILQQNYFPCFVCSNVGFMQLATPRKERVPFYHFGELICILFYCKTADTDWLSRNLVG